MVEHIVEGCQCAGKACSNRDLTTYPAKKRCSSELEDIIIRILSTIESIDGSMLNSTEYIMLIAVLARHEQEVHLQLSNGKNLRQGMSTGVYVAVRLSLT